MWNPHWKSKRFRNKVPQIKYFYVKSFKIFLKNQSILIYVDYSESNASYLFPRKLQQIQRVQKHYLIEQIQLQTTTFNKITIISYTFLTVMQKSL